MSKKYIVAEPIMKIFGLFNFSSEFHMRNGCYLFGVVVCFNTGSKFNMYIISLLSG